LPASSTPTVTTSAKVRFTHHLVEGVDSHTGPPSELEAFTIRVPKEYAGRARAAAVGVPVLVNE
jgi:hypothetical protein